jgi:hypothetical protein
MAISERSPEKKPVYQFTPTYAFQIGDLTVNRDATLTAPDGKDLGSPARSFKNSEGYELLQNTDTESPAAEETTEQSKEAPATAQEEDTCRRREDGSR